jgi:hypothetical protein
MYLSVGLNSLKNGENIKIKILTNRNFKQYQYEKG